MRRVPTIRVISAVEFPSPRKINGARLVTSIYLLGAWRARAGSGGGALSGAEMSSPFGVIGFATRSGRIQVEANLRPLQVLRYSAEWGIRFMNISH